MRARSRVPRPVWVAVVAVAALAGCTQQDPSKGGTGATTVPGSYAPSFDVKAWSNQAIEKWGAWPFNDGGDYAGAAQVVCSQTAEERDKLVKALGASFDKSQQKWFIDTFCPNWTRKA